MRDARYAETNLPYGLPYPRDSTDAPFPKRRLCFKLREILAGGTSKTREEDLEGAGGGAYNQVDIGD